MPASTSAVPALLLIATLAAACGPSPVAPAHFGAYSVADLQVGSGSQAVSGARLTVQYTVWLYSDTAPDNKGPLIETTAGSGGLVFVLGAGQVIEGWDNGIPGMREGGVRRLVVPPALGYGSTRRDIIPPDATLLFEIELLTVET